MIISNNKYKVLIQLFIMIAKCQFRSDEELTTSSNKEDDYGPIALDNHEIVVRLNQILSSLMFEKERLDEQRTQQKAQFEIQLNKRNEIISELAHENQALKQKTQKLLFQLEQKQECIASLKRVNEKLNSDKESLKSVVSYLQVKNREISYELYELKKNFMKKERLSNSSQKKCNPDLLTKKNSNMLAHLDQESFFEYNGSFCEKLPNELHRADSMPVFEFISDLMQQEVNSSNLHKQSTTKMDKDKQESSKNSSTRQLLNDTSKKPTLRKRTSISRNDLAKPNLQIKKREKKLSKDESVAPKQKKVVLKK